jgi:hypothetical protein
MEMFEVIWMRVVWYLAMAAVTATQSSLPALEPHVAMSQTVAGEHTAP